MCGYKHGAPDGALRSAADPSIVWNMRALARFGLAAGVTLSGNKKGILSDAFLNC
jgi:hypothetical protein